MGVLWEFQGDDMGFGGYTLWYTNSLRLKMAIEIVSVPMKNGDFPELCKRLPEGSSCVLWEKYK